MQKGKKNIRMRGKNCIDSGGGARRKKAGKY